MSNSTPSNSTPRRIHHFRGSAEAASCAVVLARVEERAGALSRERLARQRAAARSALEQAARSLAVPIQLLAEGPEGVPLPAGAVHWSRSHCAALAAAAVARGRDVRIGVDVEPVRARRAELAAAVLSPRERVFLGREEGDQDGDLALARAWTAKEAVLKRAGLGLAGLARVRIAGRGAEDLVWVELDGRAEPVLQARIEGHVLALAGAPSAPALHWTWADTAPAVAP